ncbi:hypothetical protein ABZ863_09075 [Saccharomonospora sp. NPDC046836]|uniref:hypothetical protein n=1 Tax=Saccharomonospora sp. NPDC046836 TaxID=3156921 RepID=UPI0033C5F4A1
MRDFIRRWPVVLVAIAGLAVGSVGTWLVLGARGEDPNPIGVDESAANGLDADSDVFALAREAWRARPATERPRGEISVLHAARVGEREVVVLIDATGLGTVYERRADGSGAILWVELFGRALDTTPPVDRERTEAMSLVVGDGAWIDTRAENPQLDAAVLAGDEVRWERVTAENGIVPRVPAMGPDSCGAKVVAEQRGNGAVRFHLLRPQQSNVGTNLNAYLSPLDAAGRRPADERPVRSLGDIGVAELRLLSQLTCADSAEFDRPIPLLFAITELWHGTLPGGQQASVLAISASRDTVLVDTGADTLVMPTSGSVRSNTAVWWFDQHDWLVVAGSPEVARIDVTLPDGRRITHPGRFLAVELGELSSSRARAARIGAVNSDGLPVTVLPH